MKYLFVCNHGQHRSAIAARLASKIAEEYQQQVKTDYFGVNDHLPNIEKQKLLQGVDAVVIMEEHMRFDLEKILCYIGPIFCLNIPDKPYDSENQSQDNEQEEREIENKLRALWNKLPRYH